MNYLSLYRRQLAILPPGEDPGGSTFLKVRATALCVTNTGQNGGVRVTALASADQIINLTLYRDAAKTDVVGAATVDRTHNWTAEWTELPDGTYWADGWDGYNAYSDSVTCVVACYKPAESPPDLIESYEYLLQTIYENPRPNPDNPDQVIWDARIWLFNTNTETYYMRSGPVYRRNGENVLQYVTRSPFSRYCLTGETKMREWHYEVEGKVWKTEENHADCGFVAVRGCTDPTATNYNPDANEDDGSCYYRPQKLGCTDPAASNYDPQATDEDGSCTYAPEVKTALLGVSLMNPVRFVLAENVDNCATFQTLDNTLLCAERFRGVRNTGYLQKVATCDHHIYQFRSNFQGHQLVLRRYPSGEQVAEVPTTQVVQNVGLSPVYAAYLKNHTNGQTRLYFNTGSLPVDAGAGDRLTITGHVDTNGSYNIASIGQDAGAGSPYLVINKAYTAAEAVTGAQVQFQLDAAAYDVYEASLLWHTVAPGRYFLELVASDTELGTVTYTSEPVDLRVEHPNTVCLDYRNFDNAFDMIWTTGIVARIRVEGQLRKRVPGGEHVLYRQPQSELTRLLGVAHRKVRLETHKLPAWLHEKLAVVLMHDMVKINAVEYSCEEGYEEPEYLEGHALSNSGAIVEQKVWFREHNDHDLGSINQQPLLIQNGGFLRL